MALVIYMALVICMALVTYMNLVICGQVDYKKNPIWSILTGVLVNDSNKSAERYQFFVQVWTEQVSRTVFASGIALLLTRSDEDPSVHILIHSSLIHNRMFHLLTGGLQPVGVQCAEEFIFRLSRFEYRSRVHIPVWGLVSHRSESSFSRGDVLRHDNTGAGRISSI